MSSNIWCTVPLHWTVHLTIHKYVNHLAHTAHLRHRINANTRVWSEIKWEGLWVFRIKYRIWIQMLSSTESSVLHPTEDLWNENVSLMLHTRGFNTDRTYFHEFCPTFKEKKLLALLTQTNCNNYHLLIFVNINKYYCSLLNVYSECIYN